MTTTHESSGYLFPLARSAEVPAAQRAAWKRYMRLNRALRTANLRNRKLNAKRERVFYAQGADSAAFARAETAMHRAKDRVNSLIDAINAVLESAR